MCHNSGVEMSVPTRVLACASRVFRVDVGELDLESGIGDFEQWDSLGHLSLVAAIQDEFEVELSVDDVIDCEKLSDFVAVLESSRLE